MKIRSAYYRFIDAIVRCCRKRRFCFDINSPHKDFSIVGPITVINKNIVIGHNVTIYPGVMFWGDGPIEIGDNVSIGNHTIIYASRSGGIKIGKDTQIAAQCYIIDMDHGLGVGCHISNQQNSVEKVIIGQDCWIGANVTILKGSIIQDGAIIGAKGLVKGTVAANAIAIGIPVRVRSFRM